jgi:soluble lytic murein transglycosylase
MEVSFPRGLSPSPGLLVALIISIPLAGLLVAWVAWSNDSAVAIYRRYFIQLERGLSFARISDRSQWPEHDLLASYLELELLFHPRSHTTGNDMQRFLTRWPNHPHVERVARFLDQRMGEEGNNAEALAWFDKRSPRDNRARLRYMGLLFQAGRVTDAEKQWRHLYRLGFFFPASAQEANARFTPTLTVEDQETRARALEKKGDAGKDLQELLAAFPNDRQIYLQALAAAREANRRFYGLVKRLPPELAKTPELWSTRVAGLRQFGFYDVAVELLNGPEGRYMNPRDRALERFRIGRTYLFLKDDPDTAYRLFSANVQEMGGKLEDSVWLAGWSARRLGRNREALELFSRLGTEGQSDERRSQGAYWAARLTGEMGGAKTHWLSKGANFPHTFYGLLSLEELHGPVRRLSGDTNRLSCTVPAGNTRIKQGIQRLKLLKEVNRSFYNGPEIEQMGSRLSLDTREQLCLALTYDAPGLALRLAQQLQNKGVTYWEGLYPAPGWQPLLGWKLHPELVWGVARQESRFKHRIASYVGARGIMQLMPATARQEANRLQLPVASRYQLELPHYNIALGQSYLHRWTAYLDGDLVLGLVAYNAGPGRAQKWRERREKEDPLTFIENIPLSETRHYVKRVLHGYAISQWRRNGVTSLSKMLPPKQPGMDALEIK